MFTEARAFSRVTNFSFSGEPAGFFLNLHSEISYPTPFSERVQRDDTNFGPFLFYSVEIREMAAGNYGRKQPANTEETAVFIQSYGTCLSQTIWCT